MSAALFVLLLACTALPALGMFGVLTVDELTFDKVRGVDVHWLCS
jgi:hypothetical protein